MRRNVIVFTILSLLAKVIAFGRELLLAYFFGTSEISDVFLLSMTLPITVFGFISAGIAPGFIPIYSRLKEKGKRNDASRFASIVLSVLLILCLLIVGVYYLFSQQINRILASGFSANAIKLAIEFTNISIWVIPLTCITTVLTAYLQINDRMSITALVSVPLNAGVMLAILSSYLLCDIRILPIGFVAAAVIQSAFITVEANRSGFQYCFTIGRCDENVNLFFKSLMILGISSSIVQINVLIDRTLATGVMVGGLSIFEYGSRINDFITGITIIPISTALFPEMAKKADDYSEVKRHLLDGSRLFLFIMIPITVIVILFSKPIVQIIYYRGAFDDHSLLYTTEVVAFYGIGLAAFALRELLSKGFYAISDTKTPMINASIGILLNIVLNFVLSKVLGIGGLALATSVSAVVCVILMIAALRKRFGSINASSILADVLKISSISFFCGFGSFLFFKFFSEIIGILIFDFGLAMIVFIGSFMLLSVLFHLIRPDEMKALLNRRRKREF